MRALAAALRATSGTTEIHDALHFRTHQYTLFPGADTLEAQLEQHEGLAEYTGIAFAQAVTNAGIEPALQGLHNFERRRSFVRSLGYGTGPALGLLLDRHAPGWRSRAGTRPLHELLAEAVGFAPSTANVLELARQYGGGDVVAEEAARAAESAARLADIHRRLVNGPVLLLSQQDLQASFNPNELVPVADAGTYYPTGRFQAGWGRIEVHHGGALLSSDWQRLRVPLAVQPPPGRIVTADGWTLELADGWSIVPLPGGGWRVAPVK